MSGSHEPHPKRRKVEVLTDTMKTLALRIDEIPHDQDSKVLETDLTSICKQDPLLQKNVVGLTLRTAVPVDKDVACATVSFETSLSAKELANRLGRAGKSLPYTYSHEFEGITPLYQSPEGASVDVIAVPGLGSHPLGSWKTPNDDIVWLRDFLPKDQPNIRVLIYGYNTALRGSLSKQSLKDLGISLLEAITVFRTRDKTNRRPVVFIGHSLGGLLIKELLVQAVSEKNARYSDLGKACLGLLFFGVPHHGLRNESLTPIVRGQPNEAFIRDLQVDRYGEPSSYLESLSSSFAERCDRYQVISFYETMVSPMLEMNEKGIPVKSNKMELLVTQESATNIGTVTAVNEKNVPLSTDHSGLVKFGYRRGPPYSIVAGHLEILIVQAVNKAPRLFADSDILRSIPIETGSCMKSLAFSTMDNRYYEIENATEHTCEWLLNHEAFQEWVKLHHGLLWITGHPGSGKSTLMKHAREMSGKEVYEPDTLTLSFFFHRRGHDLQKSLAGLFRSLLHQILSLAPETVPELTESFQRQAQTVGDVGQMWDWQLRQLQNFFSLSLPRIVRKRPLMIFIDALDEAGESAAVDLIEYLSRQLTTLSSAGSRFSVCYSCRYFPNIMPEEALAIHLGNENDGDITTYVNYRLSRCILDPDIRPLVSSRADGSFIWARLASDRVLQLHRRRESPRKIQGEIMKLPAELNELYSDLIRRDAEHSQHQTLRLMQWICCSDEPLATYELQWAMMINPDEDISLQACRDSDEFITDDRFDGRVQTLSCGLAEVVYSKGQSGVVQVIHQSVADFFIDCGIFILDDSIQASNLAIPTAHWRLALCCIRYLRSAQLGDLVNRSEEELEGFSELVELPFLRYSFLHFVGHMQRGKAAATYSPEFLDLFGWPGNVLIGHCSKLSLILDGYGHQLFDPSDIVWNCPGATLVHVVSSCGLAELLSVMLSDIDRIDVDIKAHSYSPLALAAEGGHAAIVDMLLGTAQCNADSIDEEGRTPLSRAAEAGATAVVELLLRKGRAKVDLADGEGRTPLSYAAESGRSAVVRLLLGTTQVDVDSVDVDGLTPLSWASRRRFQRES